MKEKKLTQRQIKMRYKKQGGLIDLMTGKAWSHGNKPPPTEKTDSEYSFDEIMQNNMRNLERLRKERNITNKSVKLSYRLSCS